MQIDGNMSNVRLVCVLLQIVYILLLKSKIEYLQRNRVEGVKQDVQIYHEYNYICVQLIRMLI